MKQVPNCRKINLWQSSRAIFAVATWYLSQLGTKGLVIYVFLTAVPARGSTAWLRWAVSLSETLSIPQLVPSQRSRCLMTGLPLQIEIQSSGIKKKKKKKQGYFVHSGVSWSRFYCLLEVSSINTNTNNISEMWKLFFSPLIITVLCRYAAPRIPLCV